MSEPLTVDEPRRREGVPWYAIDEWSLRRKLALALAIPMLLAATFGGLRVVNAANDASTFSRLENRVAVLKPAVRLVDSASAVAVAGRGADQGATDRARTTFDRAVTDLRQAMLQADLTEGQVTSLDQALTAAQPLRTSPANAPVGTVSAQLAEVAGHVTVVLTEFSGATADTRLTTVRDILSGQVALTEQRLLTTLPQAGTKVDPLALGNAIGEEATAIADLSSSLGPTNTFVSALAQGNELRLTAAPAVADGTAGLPRAQDAVSVYTTLANGITDQVLDTMRTRASDARTTAIRDSVATLGLLAAAVLLALAVARMLLDPIKRVRLGALDVAHEQLPDALARIRAGEEPPAVEPLPVHTGEEVGQLARAVDVLHTQAIGLATEQARLRGQVSAMFETLSRRSTSLINQQLNLIENLERDEEDPRRLESLFRLDHLAARIRRNGESLLVLAGAAPRGAAGQDLPLGDVLRAAVSEVQDYQRVQLSASSLLIRASAAPNLVHLFAELIDNALSYSPPDSTVAVTTARGIDGGVLVEIVDDGLGMTTEAMQTANDALVNGGEVTTETARRMGLYVVGQLAMRHEVTVRIRPNPESTGTVVTVFLPAPLFASGRPGPPDVAARATSGTRDDTQSAGPAASGSPAAGQRPRVTTLTAVPSLPAEPSRGDGGLVAVRSSVTPTTLPQVGDTGPLPVVTASGPTGADDSGEPAPGVTGLPRRRPGATTSAGGGSGDAHTAPPAPSTSPAVAPTRPSWGAPTSTEDDPSTESTSATTTDPAEGAGSTEVTPASTATGPASPTASSDVPLIRDLEPSPVAETPIFRQLSSSWLSENGSSDLPWASTEIDQGWQAAERAASAAPAGVSASGLPVRRPGSTLVPGQAGTGTGADGIIARDPEAIRRHLNRHRSGVQRGRREAPAQAEPRFAGSTLLDEEKD